MFSFILIHVACCKICFISLCTSWSSSSTAPVFKYSFLYGKAKKKKKKKAICLDLNLTEPLQRRHRFFFLLFLSRKDELVEECRLHPGAKVCIPPANREPIVSQDTFGRLFQQLRIRYFNKCPNLS